MNKQHFNLSKNMKSSSRICLSSDGSWKLSVGSDTSLTSVRTHIVPEISQTMATTDPVTKIHPLDSLSFSATDSDIDSIDRQSIDPRSIDGSTSEEEPPIVFAIQEEPTPTVPVMAEEPTPTVSVMAEEPPIVPATNEEASATDMAMEEEPSATVRFVVKESRMGVCASCKPLQQINRSKAVLSFGDSSSRDVCADLQFRDDGGVSNKWPVQAEVLNLRQERAYNPGGDTGNAKPIKFRCGAPENPKNMSQDMKFDKRVAPADIKKRERPVVTRPKEVAVKKTFQNKNNVIQNVYMSQTNKVSTEPAPFLRRSSSYINRQKMQRETDRVNFKIMKKLMNVKATVSSFR